MNNKQMFYVGKNGDLKAKKYYNYGNNATVKLFFKWGWSQFIKPSLVFFVSADDFIPAKYMYFTVARALLAKRKRKEWKDKCNELYRRSSNTNIFCSLGKLLDIKMGSLQLIKFLAKFLTSSPLVYQ